MRPFVKFWCGGSSLWQVTKNSLLSHLLVKLDACFRALLKFWYHCSYPGFSSGMQRHTGHVESLCSLTWENRIFLSQPGSVWCHIATLEKKGFLFFQTALAWITPKWLSPDHLLSETFIGQVCGILDRKGATTQEVQRQICGGQPWAVTISGTFWAVTSISLSQHSNFYPTAVQSLVLMWQTHFLSGLWVGLFSFFLKINSIYFWW